MIDTPLPESFLLVNKPAGWTSFDVVNYIRKQKRAETGVKNIKVGHAGTLDPFATGLLIVGVGREATKRLDEFKTLPKTYVARLHLGMVSDSGDPTGVLQENKKARKLENKKTIEEMIQTFVGRQLQTPPMHSAKSVNGVRLYKLARQGKTVERTPNEIEIYRLSLIAYEWPYLTIEVECSAGTYIRTLAEDIGEKLGTGAYCQELSRTRIGHFILDQATTLR